MQRYDVPYMIACAALGVLAARGVFHLYGAFIRRFLAVRTPDGRAARFGCFPSIAAFVIVMYGAQLTGPWVRLLAEEHGGWVFAAAIAAAGFFPAVYIVAWWLSRRTDVSAFRKGSLPEDAVRVEERNGPEISVVKPEGVEPAPRGSILLIELAVFYGLNLRRPLRPAAVYGFAHDEPFWERPLRGAWILDDTLYLLGVSGLAAGKGLPPLLVVTATLREGIEHEFARRVSLCAPGSILRPGAVRIFGLDDSGSLVLDAGGRRGQIAAGDIPARPIEWNGFLRAGKIFARERIEVSVVSYRLFAPDRVDVMRSGAAAEDLGDSARPVVSNFPPPESREPGPGYFRG